MRTILFDFTGIYREQTALREQAEEYLDLATLTGTDCYCDPETEQTLKKLLAKLPPESLRVMDSGNYHYMSRLLAELAGQKISLAVLDHHTDMQPPALLPLLSCGSWLADTLRDLPLVQEVYLIGPPYEAISQIPEEYRAKVHWISQEELEDGSWHQKLAGFHPSHPLYLSIDKDILSPEECPTNWDQGTLKPDGLKTILRCLTAQNPPIAVDLCGEPEYRQATASQLTQSTKVTLDLIHFFSC